MNQTPPKLIYIVVGALSSIAGMGMFALCGAMFYKTWADPAILTAVISLTGTAVGAVGGILSSPRSAVTSTVETTDSAGIKTTTTGPIVMAPVATQPANGEPQDVKIVNEPNQRVPVDTRPKPPTPGNPPPPND